VLGRALVPRLSGAPPPYPMPAGSLALARPGPSLRSCLDSRGLRPRTPCRPARWRSRGRGPRCARASTLGGSAPVPHAGRLAGARAAGALAALVPCSGRAARRRHPLRPRSRGARGGPWPGGLRRAVAVGPPSRRRRRPLPRVARARPPPRAAPPRGGPPRPAMGVHPRLPGRPGRLGGPPSTPSTTSWPTSSPPVATPRSTTSSSSGPGSARSAAWATPCHASTSASGTWRPRWPTPGCWWAPTWSRGARTAAST
jgi:hypothetical protein